MDITRLLTRRYAAKKFNPDKKIPAADFEQIKAALRYAPSSVNIQPWHFTVADDAAGKARIARCAAAFPPNMAKITDASHVVVIAARTRADEEFLARILAQETADGRYAAAEHAARADAVRRTFTALHRDTLQDEARWLSEQAHISLALRCLPPPLWALMPCRCSLPTSPCWTPIWGWRKKASTPLPLPLSVIVPKTISTPPCPNRACPKVRCSARHKRLSGCLPNCGEGSLKTVFPL